MHAPKVLMYVTDWCPYCMRARSLLEGKGVAIEEIDVDAVPGAREEMRVRISSRAPGTQSTSISSTATPFSASRLRARSQYGHQSVTYMRTFGALMARGRAVRRATGAGCPRARRKARRAARTHG